MAQANNVNSSTPAANNGTARPSDPPKSLPRPTNERLIKSKFHFYLLFIYYLLVMN